MTAGRRVHQVLIVEPDARVRRALADLVSSAGGLAVLAAGATVADLALSHPAGADVALVGVRRAAGGGLAAVSLLAQQVPVVAVASVGSLAADALAAGAAAFYDMDGNADALVAALRDVTDREH